MGEQTILEIGTIILHWDGWVPWPDILIDNRGGAGVYIPNEKPGVYEVKRADHSGGERLYIGETGNLRHRIRQGLAKGKTGHPAGDQIRGCEEPSRLLVRWAETRRPMCAEEELLRAYRDRFGNLPLYNRNT